MTIYQIDFETKTEINLSNSPYDDHSSNYSSDRLQITYIRRHSDRISLYIMNNDGSNQTELHNNLNQPSMLIGNPRFTPDGSKIIFGFGGEIYSINIDGTNLKQLTKSEGTIILRDLCLSPLGDKMVYNEYEWDKTKYIYHIFIKSIYGPNRTELFQSARDSYNYTFTPDGRNLLFTTNDDLYLVDINGNIPRKLFENELINDIYDYEIY